MENKRALSETVLLRAHHVRMEQWASEVISFVQCSWQRNHRMSIQCLPRQTPVASRHLRISGAKMKYTSLNRSGSCPSQRTQHGSKVPRSGKSPLQSLSWSSRGLVGVHLRRRTNSSMALGMGFDRHSMSTKHRSNRNLPATVFGRISVTCEIS